MRILRRSSVAFVIGSSWALLPPSTEGEVRLQAGTTPGHFLFEGAFPQGVLTLEASTRLEGPWMPIRNIFTTNSQGSVTVLPPIHTSFWRAVALDLSPVEDGFMNLVASYGLLSTIAGAGGSPDDINKWDPGFEGGFATEALLSNPHFAMSDDAGNVFIADKQGHAIRKVSPEGVITTVAGTSTPGNGTDEDALGTSIELNEPNGLWVRPDGVVYILDTSNGKVRRLDTDGTIRTMFSVPGGIPVGRGLWVKDDESLAYVACGTLVRRWTPDTGAQVFATGFNALGNLVVDPQGQLVITDRGGNLVYRVDDFGVPTVIAGTGGVDGGGDGQLALETGLREVRGVWFLPTGAFFLATHYGSQVWYVDTDGFIHLFLNGARKGSHIGDGTYFYAPDEARVSEIRAVTMDSRGNLLITENDSGYIRKVEFLPIPR